MNKVLVFTLCIVVFAIVIVSMLTIITTSSVEIVNNEELQTLQLLHVVSTLN